MPTLTALLDFVDGRALVLPDVKNDVARFRELIAMGVDSIETDRPDLISDLVCAGDHNGADKPATIHDHRIR